MKGIHVAKDLSVPLDAVSRPWAFVGIRGSGKTYAASSLAERFLDLQAQVVILDPIGNWYGLRLDRTGRKPSRFAIPILGGLHGDVPIEPQAGGLVADFIVDTGSSAILDVSQLRKEQRKHFATDFAEQLFHRKKSHRSPLHLAIEESQVFIPQQGKGQERMLGAFEDLVRLGRNFGIGVSMITQRPQSVNKEVLNQAEPLVVFQLVGKHERDAVKGWMQHVGADLDAAMAKLAGLQEGDCYFWSPAWLRTFQSTRFLAKETFDASSTPELGDGTKAAGKLAPVDLASLQTSMASIIEKKKADDPAELRKTIAELRKQLDAKNPATTPALKVDQQAIDRAVKKALEAAGRAHRRAYQSLRAKYVRIQEIAKEPVPEYSPPEIVPETTLIVPQKAQSVPRPVSIEPRIGRAAEPVEGITRPEQRILDAIAWMNSIGVDPPSNEAVAFMAGYSPTSSSYANPRGSLRSKGLIDYPSSGCLRLTEAGASSANHPEEAPTGEELRARVLSKLNEPQRRILRPLIDSWPDPLSNEDVAARAKYSATSSSYANPRGSLRTLGLVEYPNSGFVRAADLLFPGRHT